MLLRPYDDTKPVIYSLMTPAHLERLLSGMCYRGRVFVTVTWTVISECDWVILDEEPIGVILLLECLFLHIFTSKMIPFTRERAANSDWSVTRSFS